MSKKTIYLEDAINALHNEIVKRRISEDVNDDGSLDEFDTESILRRLPPAQPEPQTARVFQEIIVEYPPISTYPEYKGKPYFSIKYTENGQGFIGYGTYNPEVLSEYLKKYFMPSAQPERWDTCFSCPLSHGCPFIKGCTNDQAEQYAGEIPTECPLNKESAQFEPNCEGCKHLPRYSHEAPCKTCANNYINKYER